MIRTITFLFVAAALLLAACQSQPARRVERPARYHPTMLLQVDVAPGLESEVDLQFPAGYKLAADAPNKVVAPPGIVYTRTSTGVTFADTRNGDNAWIEVYYCESAIASICAFRPVEVRFTDTADSQYAVAQIPAP